MSKEWWVITGKLEIKHALGWDCSGEYKDNDGYWWFPDLGFSTDEVFETEEEVRAAHRQLAYKEVVRILSQ